MKMKGRKAVAFITTLAVLVGLYLATLVLAPQNGIAVVGSTIIIMIVTNAAVFIGGSVWSSWTKSKYFHSELIGR